MAVANLDEIRKKVRRITRNPSLDLLSNAELDQYINTFILYDMPQNLRIFELRTTLTFNTIPNVDRYSTTTSNVADPLFDFKNKYSAVHPTVYFWGIAGFYTQKPDIFYGYFPPTNYTLNTDVSATGITGPYTGTISQTPILQRSFTISAKDTVDNYMIFEDRPLDLPVPGPTPANTGNLVINRNLPVSLTNPSVGTINYLTGAWTITFPSVAATGQKINVTYILYQASRPYAMLYYDDEFVIRPVPDKVYPVQLQVERLPTELLAANDTPDLKEWWQYIALGASRKVFEDKMDINSLRNIEPLFREQEMLVQRTTLCLATNERTTTIYTVGKSYGVGFFNWGPWPY